MATVSATRLVLLRLLQALVRATTGTDPGRAEPVEADARFVGPRPDDLTPYGPMPRPSDSFDDSLSGVGGSCVWCDEQGGYTDGAYLPAAFCWTKMQAEAGQPLETILWRKELERAAGGGLFFWGVGTSLGHKLLEFVQSVPSPKVVFSTMKSQPKPEDAAPAGVLLWMAYVDAYGCVRPLPEHVIVLSRAATATRVKTRHYALACRSIDSLQVRNAGQMPVRHFRNRGSAKARIGASQVTAIVEHTPTSEPGAVYDIDLVVDLAEPYFVQLAQPVLLPPVERRRIESVMETVPNPQQWIDFVHSLKRRLNVIGPLLRAAEDASG